MRLSALALLFAVGASAQTPPVENPAPAPAPAAPAAPAKPLVVEYPQAGFRMELPPPWTVMPPILQDQVRGLLRQRFASTPLARINFNSAFQRGADFAGILNGEYLVVTVSPEQPKPSEFAAVFPQARKAMEQASSAAWEDVVADFGWGNLVLQPERGMFMWPGKAKHFDGSMVRVKFYALPAQRWTMVLFLAGGKLDPDKVFAEFETALNAGGIAAEQRPGAEYWSELEKLFTQQAANGAGARVEKSAPTKP